MSLSTSSATDDPQSPPRPPRVTARAVWAGVALILIALVAGVLLGRVGAPASASPGETSAEAGFARDMQTHHNQAVEMAILIRDRTDDDEIRLLALDIMTAQSQQAGQMFAWLNTWGLPQTGSEPKMAWMTRPALDGESQGGGHSSMEMDGSMPGFATAQQLQQLRDAEGVEAERLWLELMIAHHQGGIEMAEAVLARSEDPLVTPLATSAATLQQKEIDYMTELLEARS